MPALVIAQSDSIAVDSILNDVPTQHTESELLSMANLPIDHFDGLDTFDDLPRDGRCVRDMWF